MKEKRRKGTGHMVGRWIVDAVGVNWLTGVMDEAGQTDVKMLAVGETRVGRQRMA